MKIDPETAEAIRILKSTLQSYGIRFCLIGAQVPRIVFARDHRETYDNDFAVGVDSWAEYERVKKTLVNGGFGADSRKYHRLYYGEHTVIDLIPFGESIVKDGILEWPDRSQMTMEGYGRLFDVSEEIEVEEGLALPIAPISLYVILKVISFEDHAEDMSRERDLADIFNCLSHYEEEPIEESRRFELCSEEMDIEWEFAGAYLLGREASEYVSDPILSCLVRFQNRFTDAESPIINRMLIELGRTHPEDEERESAFRLIQTFFLGFQEAQS